MRYFIRRTLFFLLTLWAAVTLNFIIPRLEPGDPAEDIVRKLLGENRPIQPAQLHAIQLMLGIPGGNIFQQYIGYLGTLLHGQLGISYTYFPYPVTTLIGQSILWTLGLVLTTNIIGFIIGNILGAFAAWKRNSAFDSFVSVGLNFVGTLPYMWIALILLFVFAFQLQWLPISGGFSEDSTRVLSWGYAWDIIVHAMLPALSLLITGPIGWVMGMRNTMVQMLREDYTRLAMAKGLKPWKVALFYSARNAILPNVTGLAMSLGGILGGVVLVESVFDYPGMGRLFFDAVNNRDYPLMQTIFLFSVIAVLLANLLADFVVGLLDPRVRKGEQ